MGRVACVDGPKAWPLLQTVPTLVVLSLLGPNFWCKGRSMNAQMKGRQPEAPCPCGGTCHCHKEVNNGSSIVLLLILLALPVSLWFILPEKPAPRMIHVGKKICEVRFVKTDQHCTAHGSCYDRGYEEAICPP